MTLKLLHIVRRYGPVGGMERYVWELTGQLAAMGHQVEVLCERLCADTSPEHINCIELGTIAAKPRWLAYLRFSHRVSRWIADNPNPERIIHSHERTASHHITTFHGPPFATALDRAGRWRISPRVHANLWLEKREVCASQIQAVVPNAALIAKMLQRYYPCIGDRLTSPITPGVSPGPERTGRQVPTDGGIIGFIGMEWKRKGFDIAIDIVKNLRIQRPGVELWVAGPRPDEVRPLFSGWQGGFRLLGTVDSRDIYPELDLLLHPARAEPYGMVIAEAMAAKVPVLVSEQCGAASAVSKAHGAVLTIDASTDEWVEAADELLARKKEPPGYQRPWMQVALEYAALYERIAP